MKEKILSEFAKLYSHQPRVFKAPGRVNLIGEHTDYNEGFVFPMAIDRFTYVAISKRDDRIFNIFSDSYKENVTINLDTAKPMKHWSDYVVGVASTILDMGFQISGADIFIYSDVPLGAGLSSSAAIEVSTAYALMTVNGLEIDTLNLAKICQKAENDFVGMKCGIMDQFVSIH
ncbi:MAG TPA: galactokinase family protein, partial [Bacteroidota bacterium]|nr:galactokinase family protein [Bacteroidota bacterium]